MLNLIQQIHDAPHRAVVVTAGAGASALTSLLNVAGASRTLLEAVIPYSQSAFDDFLGKPPDQYVSEQAACLLAGRAYTRARQLCPTVASAEGVMATSAQENSRNFNPSIEMEAYPVVGLACTATIVTDRHKKGQHRGYIATWQSHQLRTYSIVLNKGDRNRVEEELIYSLIMLNALATSCGLSEQIELPLSDNEKVEAHIFDFAEVARQLAEGKFDFFALNDQGSIQTSDTHTSDMRPQVILSGSFNPLHDGHLGMARAASRLLERPVTFELSAFNVDKPPIPPQVILDRIGQFAGRYPIYISNAPTYVQKSRLYPGYTFIIGFDTAIRLFVTKYYNNSQAEMDAAIDEIDANGCSFLVTGRVDQDGHYRSLADVEIPHQYAHLFQELPENLFRMDISSTQLRTSGMASSR